jgi:hypothetical protein
MQPNLMRRVIAGLLAPVPMRSPDGLLLKMDLGSAMDFFFIDHAVAVQFNDALVLVQAATNCSILAISSLTLQKPPHRIALFGDDPKPTDDLVEPEGVRRRVVHVEA